MNRSVFNGPVQYAPQSYKIPCLRLDVSCYEYGVEPYDIFMVYWNRNFNHHEITKVAMAAYTFTSFAFSIVNIIKYRKITIRWADEVNTKLICGNIVLFPGERSVADYFVNIVFGTKRKGFLCSQLWRITKKYFCFGTFNHYSAKWCFFLGNVAYFSVVW